MYVHPWVHHLFSDRIHIDIDIDMCYYKKKKHGKFLDVSTPNLSQFVWFEMT